MIITDQNLRPKGRFHEVLLDYFTIEGFSFKKSQNKFERKFDGGIEIVFVSFLTYSSLVGAQLSWGLKYDGLENIYSQLKGFSKKIDLGYCFGLELNHHPEIRFSGQLVDFPLFDSSTLRPDDFIIDDTAQKLIMAFKLYALPFFEKYRDKLALEREINQLPIEELYFTNWTEIRILYGVVLAKIFGRQDFEEILKSYEQFIERKINKSDLKDFLLKSVAYANSLPEMPLT